MPLAALNSFHSSKNIHHKFGFLANILLLFIPMNSKLIINHLATPFSICRTQLKLHPLPVHLIPSNTTPISISTAIAGSFSHKFRPHSSLSGDTVVVTNKNYGNKEIISITPPLYDYLLDNVREPQILRELREETAKMRGSRMQVSPDQAQLLAMLVQISGAERCIEVGVYTGYSSLAVALVLPQTGRLIACERDVKSLEVAKRYYERAGVADKVVVKHGLAKDTLKGMIQQESECCSYDFAFVDAEKRMYQEYFELLLQLVKVGGMIVFDNVLWHGKVVDLQTNDPKTISIRAFNKMLMEDERVNISMVPIGDGMTICRKR